MMDENVEIHPATNPETVEEDKLKAEHAPSGIDVQKGESAPYPQDAFGDEEGAEIKYKVLKWWYGILTLSFATGS